MSMKIRSPRKPEALTISSGNPVAMFPQGIQHDNFEDHTLSDVLSKKRARESSDSDDHLYIKGRKTKLSVEIPPPKKKSYPNRGRAGVIKSNATPDFVSADSHSSVRLPSADAQATQPPSQQQQTSETKRYKRKVAKGLQHELDGLKDRIQAKDALSLKDGRRKLRSQEGVKFKSELSAYFPEYDEVIGNVPKEDDFLDVETRIVIINTSTTFSKKPRTSKRNEYPVRELPTSLFSHVHSTQIVDLPVFASDDHEDPLSEEYFKALHKRPERQEKAVRNADKSRAQHERDSVIRLLEGLQGADWLKTLGVNGITESRKKEFDSARQYFIKGCESILEKFRMWRDDEKQRKLKRERAMAKAKAEAESVVDDEEEEEEKEDDDVVSNGDPPDLSDIDASAARQLHDEAMAVPRRRARTNSVPVEREFKSFFAKPHLRDAALGKHRRSGRSIAAWGHPIPDLPERVDFNLPEEYLDEETLRAHARKKRRDRRIMRE